MGQGGDTGGGGSSDAGEAMAQLKRGIEGEKKQRRRSVVAIMQLENRAVNAMVTVNYRNQCEHFELDYPKPALHLC